MGSKFLAKSWTTWILGSSGEDGTKGIFDSKTVVSSRLDDLTAKYGFSALEQMGPSELANAVEQLSTEDTEPGVR